MDVALLGNANELKEKYDSNKRRLVLLYQSLRVPYDKLGLSEQEAGYLMKGEVGTVSDDIFEKFEQGAQKYVDEYKLNTRSLAELEEMRTISREMQAINEKYASVLERKVLARSTPASSTSTTLVRRTSPAVPKSRPPVVSVVRPERPSGAVFFHFSPPLPTPQNDEQERAERMLTDAINNLYTLRANYYRSVGEKTPLIEALEFVTNTREPPSRYHAEKFTEILQIINGGISRITEGEMNTASYRDLKELMAFNEAVMKTIDAYQQVAVLFQVDSLEEFERKKKKNEPCCTVQNKIRE